MGADSDKTGDTPGTGREEAWPDVLVAQFARIAEALQGPNAEACLVRIVRAAALLVPEADLVSVTVRENDASYTTPAATGELATRLDELQYQFDEGPCVEATCIAPEGVVDVPEIANGPWPKWAPRAAALGMGSVFAVGLVPGQDPPRAGALNFYSRRAFALDKVDRDMAVVLAGHATVVLAAYRGVSAATRETAQLRLALHSRDVIGQAKGILMHREGITADEAFEILRRTSQELNVKLANVAELLVARHGEL